MATVPTTNGLPANSWMNGFKMMQGQPQMQALQDWTRTQPGYENFTPAPPSLADEQKLISDLHSWAPDPAKSNFDWHGVTAGEFQAPEQQQGAMRDASQSFIKANPTMSGNDMMAGLSEVKAPYQANIDSLNRANADKIDAWETKQLTKNDNDFMHKLVGGIASGALGAAGGALLGGSILGPAGDWAGLANSVNSGVKAAGSPVQQNASMTSAALRAPQAAPQAAPQSAPMPVADPQPVPSMVANSQTAAAPTVTPGPVVRPQMTQSSSPAVVGGIKQAGMMSQALRGKNRWM